MPDIPCHPGRSLALWIAQQHIGAAIEQRLRRGKLAGAGGRRQRGFAIVVKMVDAGTLG